jgi:hypothetical protein
MNSHVEWLLYSSTILVCLWFSAPVEYPKSPFPGLWPFKINGQIWHTEGSSLEFPNWGQIFMSCKMGVSANAYRVCLQCDKNAVIFVVVMIINLCEYTKIIELHTSNRWNMTWIISQLSCFFFFRNKSLGDYNLPLFRISVHPFVSFCLDKFVSSGTRNVFPK